MGAVPAIFISYGQSSEAALHVAIFYAVYYQLDANYIMPKIMGQKIDLHPVLVIASLLIGAKLFGILGMIFAVPVAAVYRVLYKELWHSAEEGVPAKL
jgi:predicted PurR-regulated permease PerM